jgi:hypothetical protein
MIVQSKVNDSALNGHGDGLGPVGEKGSNHSLDAIVKG